MNRLIKRLLCCLLTALLLLTAVVSAFAEPVSPESVLDPSRTGSIVLTMKRSDGTPVGGGSVTLYPVARAVHDPYTGDSLEYLPPFDGMADAPALDYESVMDGFSILVPEDDPEAESGNARYAQLYLDWLKEYLSGTPAPDYAGIVLPVDQEGVAKDTLPLLGLYLVVQEQADSAPGYFPIRPFLISVPNRDENGNLVYEDVDAAPKMEPLKPLPPKPEDDEDEPVPTPPAGPLPQTGQLNWPVPLLAIAGMVLFILGWKLNADQKERERNKHEA